MADISKFKSPDNTEYTLKDSVSRFRFDVQTGTGTAGQAGSSSKAYIPSLWKYNLGMTPAAGDIITITIPVAGVNAGVWISVDNGSHYYPIAVNNKTRLTTQYAIDNQITMIYQENMVTTTYGTDTTGAAAGASAADLTSDRWVVLNYYDANTTYSNASLGQGYGTCDTAAATAAKEVTLSSYALTTGGIVAVKFTYDVPANATMNINAKGAKYIYYKGAKITAGVLKAGDIGVFIYSSYYHLIGIDKAIDRLLPAVTSSDNGKVLRVVSGAWAAAELPSASGVSF